MNIINLLKQVVRLGTVTAIYDDTGYLQVTFFDKDENPRIIPMFSFINEYNMPDLKDTVLCLFLPGYPDGFCLGKWFASDNPPPVKNRNIWYKALRKKGFMSFDDETETLTIKAKHIVLAADDTVTDGDVVAGGISLRLHVHGNGNNGADTTKGK